MDLEHFLVGIAREELLKIVSSHELFGGIGLKSPEDLGLDSYKKKINRKMFFVYDIEKWNSPEEVAKDVWKYLSKYKSEDIRLKLKINSNVVDVDFYIGSMYVPMTLNFIKPNSNFVPIMSEQKGLLYEDVFTYSRFPIEEHIAEDLFVLIQNLGLVNDMSKIMDTYQEICSSNMDGKRIWLSLKEVCDSSKFICETSRIEALRKLSSDNQMKNKWDKYIKRHNNQSDDIDKVIDTLVLFIEPVWDAICSDTGFVGDWIPDIKRYL